MTRFKTFIWTVRCAFAFWLKLGHHGWSVRRCWELAEGCAENGPDMYDSPSEAVYEELSCWTE